MMLLAAFMTLSAGCLSLPSGGCLFGGTVAETKAYLDRYDHVLLVCITGDTVTRAELPAKSERHFTGTVVRVYKGDWGIGERISWVSQTELAKTETVGIDEYKGKLTFVFTDTHTDRERFLDTGDAPWWGKDLAQQIEAALR
jgi:hypothetical protein